MTKATHNGTCQACGRSQAFRNTMAKHGYTTESGYFNGTCSGSDRLPLELETSHNEDVVVAVRDWADKQDAFANGNIETVPVSVRDTEASSRFAHKTIHVTREAYIAHNVADWHADSPETDWNEFNGEKWDKKADSVRFQLRRAATFARKDADNLEALRTKTFGNDLTPREIENAPQPQRESFSADATGGAMRKAYGRQRELKAEGIRSRVTGDARYSTITYRK